MESEAGARDAGPAAAKSVLTDAEREVCISASNAQANDGTAGGKLTRPPACSPAGGKTASGRDRSAARCRFLCAFTACLCEYATFARCQTRLTPRASLLGAVTAKGTGARKCSVCGKEEGGELKLKVCSACKHPEDIYCSTECQVGGTSASSVFDSLQSLQST